MSTIKVTNIEHESTTDGGIQLDSSGHVTIDGQQLPTAGALSNRNMLINGSHDVNQRDQGSFTPSHNNFCSDRWRMELSDASKYTAEQSSTSPDGFRKSLKITSSSAFTPAADDYFLVTQDIEGYNSAPAAFGSSGAKSVTLSFWVRSSLTGTFACSIRNSAFNRTHIKEYTISTADTWEHKTLTFPGITDGTWNTGSTVGIRVHWSLGAGSDFHGAADTTLTTNDFTTSSATNVVATNGATWFMTGAQFELGATATPFEHRSYGDELARCQRYTHAAVANGSLNNFMPLGIGRWRGAASAQIAIQHPVELRTVPTLESNTAASTFHINTDGSFAGASPTSVSLNEPGLKMSTIYADYSTGGRTVGQATTLYCSGTQRAKLVFSAEL
jgi:hypothetical protein